MTVTNAAATVARNTEIDTKASTLDFGPNSIVLLKKTREILRQEYCFAFELPWMAGKLRKRGRTMASKRRSGRRLVCNGDARTAITEWLRSAEITRRQAGVAQGVNRVGQSLRSGKACS